MSGFYLDSVSDGQLVSMATVAASRAIPLEHNSDEWFIKNAHLKKGGVSMPLLSGDEWFSHLLEANVVVDFASISSPKTIIFQMEVGVLIRVDDSGGVIGVSSNVRISDQFLGSSKQQLCLTAIEEECSDID